MQDFESRQVFINSAPLAYGAVYAPGRLRIKSMLFRESSEHHFDFEQTGSGLGLRSSPLKFCSKALSHHSDLLK